MHEPLLERLIDQLRILPGVGQKTAQRMAYHLLERDRAGGRALAQALQAAMDGIGHCRRCRNFSQAELCRLCSAPGRNDALLCVVEQPADLAAIEASGSFEGRYFVLHGRLSPLDGVGPDALGLEQLPGVVAHWQVGEVILATSATLEGEATAQYIQALLQGRVRLTKIAHGVPLGGELEYIDANTLAHALSGRKQLEGNEG